MENTNTADLTATMVQGLRRLADIIEGGADDLAGAADRLADIAKGLKALAELEAQQAPETPEPEAPAPRRVIVGHIVWQGMNKLHVNPQCGSGGRARILTSPVVMDAAETPNRACKRCSHVGFETATPETIARAAETYRRKLYANHGLPMSCPAHFTPAQADHWLSRATDLNEGAETRRTNMLKELGAMEAGAAA